MDETNKMDIPNSSELHSNDKLIDNILKVNDDCLIIILRYLSLSEMCDVAETCTRLRNVVRYIFILRGKKYAIPQDGIKFTDHQRILKNFGDLIHEVGIVNFSFVDGMNKEQMECAFDWLENYCADTLKGLSVFTFDSLIFPPSAMRLMTKLQKIEIFSPISDNIARSALCNCKELVELKIIAYNGYFHFANQYFPHLRILAHRVKVDFCTDFYEIETFFKNHTKLIALSTQFIVDWGGRIDLSFIKHLVDLEKLCMILGNAKIKGVDAFIHLKKLKELSMDHSHDVKTDAAILENLASVDSLMKLELGLSEVNEVIAAIGRFKNLTEFIVSQDLLQIFIEFNTNISHFTELRNSRLTDLKISCKRLLEPNAIVDVIRNLEAVKTIKLFGEIELTETICKRLAAVCSSQKRKVQIILDEEVLDGTDTDFDFIDKFNEDYEQFVEIIYKSAYL